MTALFLWLGLVIGSGLGILTERQIRIREDILASGKLCEGEQVSFHRDGKVTTFTATKGTILLKNGK